MTKLKLGPIAEDKPVRLTIDLPASLFADLRLYGELLGADGPVVEPVKLVVPMLERFIATDRGFAGARRSKSTAKDE
jgi:hypothetical protein